MKQFMRKLKYNIRHRHAERSVPSASIEYSIKKGYAHRLDNESFDATGFENAWQKEVYEFAADEGRKIGAKTVFDIGCGSGFKLIKNFETIHTVGFEVAETVAFLKEKYPGREWRISSFDDRDIGSCDVMICADVIEHIPDPDALMNFMAAIPAKLVVISTPDRMLVYGFDQSGPPLNPAHCREWTREELTAYASNWFDVVENRVTNAAEGTQMIVCRPKGKGN